MHGLPEDPGEASPIPEGEEGLRKGPHPGAHLSGEELSAYLDGALPPRRTTAASRHLAGCSRCAAGLTALRTTKIAVAALPAGEPDPAWLPAVTARLRRGGTLRPRLSHRSQHALRRRAGLAAAAMAALAAGIWFAPPPAPPISFRQEVRQHLVLIDQPTADQTSYVVEARTP